MPAKLLPGDFYPDSQTAIFSISVYTNCLLLTPSSIHPAAAFTQAIVAVIATVMMSAKVQPFCLNFDQQHEQIKI